MELLLHLANGEQIGLTDFQLPLHAVTVCPDMAALDGIYQKLTDENLAQIFVTQDGDEVRRWNHAVLDGFQAVIHRDRSITAHFYLSGAAEPRETDADYVAAAKILLGEEE